MRPELHPGEYVFTSIPDAVVPAGAAPVVTVAEEEGVGTIAGPEGVLAQAKGEGLIVADLDFDRLAFLRAEDEKIEFPKRYATIPGVQRWRRPELYAALVAKDHASLAGPSWSHASSKARLA